MLRSPAGEGSSDLWGGEPAPERRGEPREQRGGLGASALLSEQRGLPSLRISTRKSLSTGTCDWGGGRGDCGCHNPPPPPRRRRALLAAGASGRAWTGRRHRADLGRARPTREPTTGLQRGPVPQGRGPGAGAASGARRAEGSAGLRLAAGALPPPHVGRAATAGPGPGRTGRPGWGAGTRAGPSQAAPVPPAGCPWPRSQAVSPVPGAPGQDFQSPQLPMPYTRGDRGSQTPDRAGGENSTSQPPLI